MAIIFYGKIPHNRCPVDLYVFPELHKTPDGALEAEFYAFKIPDSTFLVFQATVRTCRGPCEPVICNDKGRGHAHFPSWGRRRREVPSQTDHGVNQEDQTTPASPENDYNVSEIVADETVVSTTPVSLPHSTSASPFEAVQLPFASYRTADSDEVGNEAGVVDEPAVPEEEVHELFRVYMSRAEVPDPGDETTGKSSSSSARMTSREEVLSSGRQDQKLLFDRVCVSQSGYYALLTAITVLTTLVLTMGVAGTVVLKNSHPNKVIQ